MKRLPGRMRACAANSGAASALSDPSPYVRTDGVDALLYETSANHVGEISFADGWPRWGYSDLNAFAQPAGAPSVAVTPAGSQRPDGYNHVVYKTPNGHFVEMWLDGNGWHWADLTKMGT